VLERMQGYNKTLTSLYKSAVRYPLEASKLNNATLTLFNSTLVPQA
jgi:hypothetical protein